MSLQATLEHEEEQIKQIKEQFSQIQASGNIDEYCKSLSPKEVAEFNLNLAYTLSSLYYVHLKLSGIDTSTHPILTEIQRIQKGFVKIQPPEIKPENQVKLNKNAAARMIKPGVKVIDEDQYKTKQKSLLTEEKDFSKRLKSNQSNEQKNLNLWDDDNQQKLQKGNLMPKQGHLNWKQKIEGVLNQK
ncbi:hypothetical protein pb186bvf_006510 [Paramecium bursaria]